MTEAEAMEKWCPWASSRAVRYMGGDGRYAWAIAAFPGGDPGLSCIGSACMAWCWRDPADAASGYCGLVKP